MTSLGALGVTELAGENMDFLGGEGRRQMPRFTRPSLSSGGEAGIGEVNPNEEREGEGGA